MECINRSMENNLLASAMIERLKQEATNKDEATNNTVFGPDFFPKHESRTERRARERAEKKAAKRAAKRMEVA